MDNPFYEDGKWFWYDETWDVYGPYETAAEAQDDLEDYWAELDAEEVL